MRFSASGCRLVEYVDLACFPDQRLENRWKIRMLEFCFVFVALEVRQLLFLGRSPGSLGVLSKHGPRAFGGAFGVGLEGIELFVS